jgi:DNA-binding Xre family transcriptional regulator
VDTSPSNQYGLEEADAYGGSRGGRFLNDQNKGAMLMHDIPPERWLHQLNQRYPNLWAGMRKYYNDPQKYLLPVYRDHLRDIPSWCPMPGMRVISYQPLWRELEARNMDRQALKTQGIVNHSTLYRLLNDEPVSMAVLAQLCDTLDLPVEKVVVFNKV